MFFGRESELESLRMLLDKRTASLVACRGRRRIGKSTLIEEFSRRNGLRLVEIDGLMPRKGMSNQVQLDNFIEKLSLQTSVDAGRVNSWMEAFLRLDEAIGSIGGKERVVVLLDEISWMGRYDGDFAGYLKSAWDTRLKRHPELILVACGSVSIWIKKNIVENTGFAGRVSKDIVLRELPIALCREFWGAAAQRIAPREIIDVLSVTGGIPRYLEEINPSLSAEENIRRICFHRDGTLFKDFKAIFDEVFGEEASVRREILRHLSSGAKTCSELASEMGVERGGSISASLDVLCESGFVARDAGCNPETGAVARQSRYRICDNYTRFYLRYIEPHENEILSDRYVFESLNMLPGWESVMGLQFENLVLNNVNALLGPLHFSGVPVISAAPYLRRGRKRGDGSGEKGFQIDLLVQTRRSVCVVEVKRQNEIGEEVEREVDAKVRRLKVPEGVSKRTALVYDGHLAPVVRGDGYFDAIISSCDLLGINSSRS